MYIEVLKSSCIKSRKEYFDDNYNEMVYIPYITVKYDFTTVGGMRGYFESPKFNYTVRTWDLDRRINMSRHEEIEIDIHNKDSVPMYLQILNPEPYEIIDDLEKGVMHCYLEKEFYRLYILQDNFL